MTPETDRFKTTIRRVQPTFRRQKRLEYGRWGQAIMPQLAFRFGRRGTALLKRGYDVQPATGSVQFISDEIYHGLTYERSADTTLAFSRQALTVNSFWKYNCMTGWRDRLLVLPKELVRSIEQWQQSLVISVPYLG
jgi:hypothetical protein